MKGNNIKLKKSILVIKYFFLPKSLEERQPSLIQAVALFSTFLHVHAEKDLKNKEALDDTCSTFLRHFLFSISTSASNPEYSKQTISEQKSLE